MAPGNIEKPDSDVVVIGAGIVGVCCALSLLRAGFSVRIIDKAPPGEGASHGNAGVISPWSFIPLALPGIWKQVPGWLADPLGPLKVRWLDSVPVLPWALRFFREGAVDRYPKNADAMARLVAPCIDTYRHFLAGSDGNELIRDSSLVSLISGDPPPMDSPAWRLRSDRGASIRIVNRAELSEIEPAVGPRYSGAVVLSGQARALSPGRLCKALAGLAQQSGARFTQNQVRNIGLDAEGLPRIALDTETLTAGRVVLAAGAWSARLLGPLTKQLNLPMVGERGYHLEFTRPGVSLNNSVMDPETMFIASSMAGGIRAAGTSEFAQLERAPDYQRARILATHIQRMLPDINIKDTEQWMGTRASLPDSLPAIGSLPGAERIVLAFGQSHWGMSMAPGTGLMVAAMIAGTEPFTDPGPYRPDRFTPGARPIGQK